MIHILASRSRLVARLRHGRDTREFLAHVYGGRMPRVFQVGAALARMLSRKRESSSSGACNL